MRLRIFGPALRRFRIAHLYRRDGWNVREIAEELKIKQLPLNQSFTSSEDSLYISLLFAALTASSAQTFTTLSRFNGTDAQGPNGPLALGVDGRLYGTTAVGGANGNGTVFNIAPGGNLTSFQSVCTGRACPTNPLGGLVASTSGTEFYGTTMYGGANGDYGSVFKITSTGKLLSLYNFCSQSNCTDGTTPFAGLTPDSAGNFYGTTGYGGVNCVSGTCAGGTVFRITAKGKLTTLHSFCSWYRRSILTP